MQRLEVIGRIPTLNWYRNAHFRSLHKAKQEWHERIGWAIKEAKIKSIPTPLTLHVTVFSKRLRDADGGILAAKFANDTFVQMGLIPNDTPEYVQTIVLTWRKATDEEKVVYLLQ